MPAHFLIRPDLSAGGVPDAVSGSVVLRALEALQGADRRIPPALLFSLLRARRQTD